MSQTVMIGLLLLLLVPLWLRLRKDFIGGLAYAVAVLVSATSLLRIDMPGNLPQLTIHRLVLVSLATAWLRAPGRRPVRGAPVTGWMLAYAGVTFVSLLGGTDWIVGVKRYLEFIAEILLFYVILATTLRGRDDALRLVRAAAVGISIVAVMAVCEKYSGVNLVDRFIMPEGDSPTLDVRATYRHRILLGSAMAMGLPLALALRRLTPIAARRALAWAGIVTMVAACYFAMSRGPWLAAIIAGVAIAVLGSAEDRRPLAVLVGLSVIALLIRPGVLGTLSHYVTDTMHSDTFKGGTFQYRLELWKVAFDGIKHSAGHLLFGLGPAAGMNQAIEWTLSYQDRKYNIASWDNDYAYALYQFGFVGLAMTLALYGTIAWRLLTACVRSTGLARSLNACIFASAVAFCFMMSNVHIFAAQLHYLFWTVTAVGLAGLGRQVPSASGSLGSGMPRGDDPAKEASGRTTEIPRDQVVAGGIHVARPAPRYLARRVL